ncbi:MAG: hypothetical protein GQ580_06460 [Candidatus Thorarchaeota archaeon]|nr:hypothetical protein [Candidatus Thorarchaeota archaeon]
MLDDSLLRTVEETIERFPVAHRDTILKIWNDWLDTNPQDPFYASWSDFSSQHDDQEALYTETRVFLKKVANELREREVPRTSWQKIAKALAAAASVLLVVFLALSRAFHAEE